MAQACGIIEVFGLVTAFEAADAGCKAANVTLEPLDRNKPANADALPVPLIICVKFRGTVMDVTAAVDAAQEVAERTTGMVSRYIISGPDEGTQMMFGLNAFDKN